MPRQFETADYATTLKLTISRGEAGPPNHLARCIGDVIAQLDLSAIYGRNGERGGKAIAPEVRLAVLCYGYATGVFSSRKLEQATGEALPFRFVPGNRLWSARATLAHAANWPNAESREPFGIRRGRYTPACPPYRESADARTGHPTWLSGDAPGQIVRGLNAPTTAPPA